MKFLKIGNQIINLALVQSIEMKQNNSGGAGLYFYVGATDNDILTAFYGDEAKYVWDWLNEHIDMTVCPMTQEVTK